MALRSRAARGVWPPVPGGTHDNLKAASRLADLSASSPVQQIFLADAQMGFGPLVAVYLTAQKWTQGDIGLVLTAGSLVALVGQIPGGALVDAARSERVLAGQVPK